MNVPATVFVVDPDESTRDYLSEIAKEMGVPCEGYESGEDFLATYKEHRPGCLVAEFRLLGISGIELQESLAAESIALPVLFVTRFPDIRFTVRAMQNGAITVLGKPVSSQDLWDGLDQALAQSNKIRLTAAARQHILARFAKLSGHERNVLPFLLASMSDKKIATLLGENKRIVQVARRKIFKKTGTENVAELSQMMRVADVAGERTIRVPSAIRQDVSHQLREVLDEHRETLARASNTSMPELVGGIVHEISQPLQAIADYSAIIDRAVQQEQSLDEIQACNEMISKASKLATGIVRRCRAFVLETKVDRRDESLDEIVTESILILKLTAEGKHVNLRFKRDVVTAKVDRVQIQQVVINLLKNAIESAAENPINDRAVTVKLISNPNNAEIIVSDNGSGISEADLSNIFKSFHSSKDNGLGLGLATSKRIVESHDGNIWYEPNDPQGASFHVKLPLSS